MPGISDLVWLVTFLILVLLIFRLIRWIASFRSATKHPEKRYILVI